MRDAYLPTVNELHAFTACARTGSTTRAAEELNLTQSAVSRSLGALEKRLGVLLFHRVRQRLILSDAGRVFSRDAARILGELDNAAVTVMAFGGHSDVLRLAVLPTFGTRWLVPRLREFAELVPDVTFDIVSRLDPVNFEAEPFDAAIQRNELHRAGVRSMPIVDETLVVLAAPELLGGKGLLDEAELARLPLLQQATRPSLWVDWFGDIGIDPRSILRGPRFEHFDMVLSAAVSGLGLALVPEILAEAEITSGRLVRASPRRLRMDAPYALIYPEQSAEVEAFAAFRDWLGGSRTG